MCYIGVDLGGTNITVGLVNAEGKLMDKLNKPTYKQRGITKICEDIAAMCVQLIEVHALHENKLKGIGIGAPGTIDRSAGCIVYSNNIEVRDFNIVNYMKHKLEFVGIEVPIYVANDADCAALGEVVAGGAKGAKDAIVVTLGTGVGSGIIIGGKIFSGFYPGGAEFGHQIIEKDGRLCTCGNKGCLEAYASATALIKVTREKAQVYPTSLINTLVKGDLSRITAKTPFEAYKKEDEIAREIIREYIGYLGIGISNMINIFKPQVILIGGGVSRQENYLIHPLIKTVKTMVFGGKLETEIKIATLGNDAGLIGAAMLSKN